MAHDALAVFGSRIGVSLLGTVTGIILARVLGPHDRGILALVLLLPSTLLTFSKLGITQANVYCVRREGAPPAAVAVNSLILACVLGGAIAGLVWVCHDLVLSTVMRGVPLWALALALWRLPLLLIDNFFNGVLQSVGNFSIYNVRTLLGAAFVLACVAAAAMLGQLDLTAAVVIYALSTTGVVLTLLVRTRHVVPYVARPDGRLLRRQLDFGVKSYVQILAMHLLFRIDVYMVAYFLNPAQTAFYSLALHFTEMVLEIPQAIGWVLYPKLASLEKASVHALTAQACRRTLLLTGLGGLGAVTLGPILVPLWYGEAFAAAVQPLALATVGMVMMSVFTILSRDFTSRNSQRINIWAGSVALVTNVILNTFLIPLYGISGAALATSIAYTLAAGLLLSVYRRESGIAIANVLIPNRDDVRFIVTAAWQAWRRRAVPAAG